MQDYGDLPPRGFPPLIGAGAWPDSVVDTCALLLLILAVALCYAAYRAGQRYERDAFHRRSSHAPEIIFAVVRKRIDIALMATGENIFPPVGKLIETIDNHLSPVLKLSDGKFSLGQTIHKLKHVLTVETKNAEGHGTHGPAHGGSTVIIAAPGAASASASVAGAASVSVVESARIVEIPAQGGHKPSHDPHGDKVPLSAKERALAVREALESLADYWQRERVVGDLRAAQTALMIDKAVGDATLIPVRALRERPVRERPVANPVEKAAREANKGIFPLFKL